MTVRAALITPDEFTRATGVAVRGGVSGAQCTTFAIGGALIRLIEPETRDQLRSSIQFLTRHQQPYRVLGAGSNLLIDDQGVDEWVIRLGGDFKSFQCSPSGAVVAGAASSLLRLSRECSEAGLSGLEFAGGIPGSLGGAVRMNAGAHGGELAAVLQSVEVITSDGAFQRIPVAQLAFAYRHSELPQGAIVVGAELALVPGDAARSRTLRAQYLAERKVRQPLQAPSAGSVFRNPSPDRTAGWLIEQCGLKGHPIGGARVSELHGNWIINPHRTATAADVRALIALCQEAVAKRYGVSLHPEVVRW